VFRILVLFIKQAMYVVRAGQITFQFTLYLPDLLTTVSLRLLLMLVCFDTISIYIFFSSS